MKYNGKEQIKTLLLNSSTIVINPMTCQVNFIGVNLDKCVLKLKIELMEEIIKVCKILEIEYYIVY